MHEAKKSLLCRKVRIIYNAKKENRKLPEVGVLHIDLTRKLRQALAKVSL